MNDISLDRDVVSAYWQSMPEREPQSYVNKSTCRTYERKNNNGNKDIQMESYHGKITEATSESQNFCLRLSEGSSINMGTESGVNNYDNDIIVISDSSTSASPMSFSRRIYESSKSIAKDSKTHILDTTDSDDSDSEDRSIFNAWENIKKQNPFRAKQERKSKNTSKINRALLTSDESSPSSSDRHEQIITNSSSINKRAQTTESSSTNSTRTPSQSNEKYRNQTVASPSTASDSSTFSNRANRVLIHSHIPNKVSSAPNKLTRQDARNIIKNIKSTKAVYESPRQQNVKNVIIDESADDDVHPAISPKNQKQTEIGIIDETIESESDVPNSQTNAVNPYKTHVSRFLDTPAVDANAAELSARKKKQISQWLMTNSPESKSDSSFSNIPPSTRNSTSSGNSSLDRLEMNYETPNNRGKIPKPQTSGKKLYTGNNTPTPVQRQATLHEIVKKARNKTPKVQTPGNINNNETTSDTETPQNVNIMQCADILDKLYGNVWREKADIILPSSEPRKHVTSLKDRAVQTEKKPPNQKKHRVIESGDASSDSSSKNERPFVNSTKRTQVKRNKRRDTFINDNSSSESGRDSSYYTALTHPRVSTNSILPKSASVIKPRCLAICDSESEDEDCQNDAKPATDFGKRKLCYSDDDDDGGSSTSEFDPGDNVPPKPVPRKEPAKATYQAPKTNIRSNASSTNYRNIQKKSFLQSLSDSVPIAHAHPDAKKYRTDFKNNKNDLCKYLYKLYNEKVFEKKLPEDMPIEWNVRMRGTAGYCYNKKSIKALGGVVKSSRIVLSTKVLDTPDRLRDTLIHEMCHAAAWLINNVSDGHGPYWTAWANGAMRAFPELPQIRRCHDYKIKTKFTYKCTGCGYSIGRHSKSLDVERKRCGHCYGKFELLINKTTKQGTVQVQTPKREPTGFALYVKENYGTMKKDCNMKHAEIMKMLGQQFSAVRIAKQNKNGGDNDPINID